MSALMMALGISPFMVGCKTSDEGPRPFVMPAKPVLNLPSAYASGPTTFSTPTAGIPANSSRKLMTRKPLQQPKLPVANGTQSRAN